MNIHQIQVKYDPNADRLLLQVRTREAELFMVWLTRRMALRLWPPFTQAVAALAVSRQAPDAMVSTQAREMLAQVARERPLPNSDFKTQFSAEVAQTPLGPEPILANEIHFKPTAEGGLTLQLREPKGRSLSLQVTEELSLALMRLMEQALVASEWGVVSTPTPAQGVRAGDTPPTLLN